MTAGKGKIRASELFAEYVDDGRELWRHIPADGREPIVILMRPGPEPVAYSSVVIRSQAEAVTVLAIRATFSSNGHRAQRHYTLSVRGRGAQDEPIKIDAEPVHTYWRYDQLPAVLREIVDENTAKRGELAVTS